MSQQRLYHIGFGRKDLGATPPITALLCGDPERARRIAMETDGVKCLATLSENRGLHSYLCQNADGRKFVASTSGMGAPSLSIVVNELVAVGIRTIIRVGTSGGIGKQVKAGDLVISSAALCRQGAARDKRGIPPVKDSQLRDGGRHPVQNGPGLWICCRLCLCGAG